MHGLALAIVPLKMPWDKWTRVLNLGLLFVLVRCIASFAILQVQLTFPSARFHYLYVVRTSDGLGFPSNQAIISSLSLA
jgi:hypothetical protein